MEMNQDIIVSGSVGINAFRSLISVVMIATKICRNVVTLDIVFQRFRLKIPTHIGLVMVNAYPRNRNVDVTVMLGSLNAETGVFFQAN